MGIYVQGKVKGEEEFEGKFFVNSGADVILLPKKVSERIKPKLIGETELILADGSRVKRDVYEVKVELEDSKGKRKSCSARATIENVDEVVISFEVLEKLHAILNIREKTVVFED